MRFMDDVPLEGVRFTSDGYLIAQPKIARAGIYQYQGREVGRPDLDVVRVYRSPEEVFSGDAMASFCHKALTQDHPPSLLSPKTWRKYAVGFTGGDIARDGDFLRLSLMVCDGDTVQAVKAGKTALSAGYSCTLDWTPGTTPDGQEFDCQQRAIVGDHLSIVEQGRAGKDCRIPEYLASDASQLPSLPHTHKDRDMPEVALRTVTVDGLSIQVTDQGAQIIERLQKQLADTSALMTARDAAVESLKADHAKAIETKDAEVAAARDAAKSASEAVDGKMAAMISDHAAALAARDGEVAALRDSIPDATKLDGLIAARAAVIDAARKILGDAFDPKGKSDADIRRAAVVKRLGDAMVSGKSDEFVGAAFETLSAVTAPPAGRDPVRDALRTAQPVADAAGSQSAHDAYVENLRNAWKGESQKGAA